MNLFKELIKKNENEILMPELHSICDHWMNSMLQSAISMKKSIFKIVFEIKDVKSLIKFKSLIIVNLKQIVIKFL